MTLEIVNHTRGEACIRNFDKTRFVDPAVIDEEWTHLWRTQWLLAGLESDVAHPGQFFVFDLYREQILVTRTGNGAVQGYYNVCQHRGNRLVTDERGTAANFRCAYHAWTYDLEGELAAVPYEERFADGVPCEERALKKVHTAIWNGFVFVNLSVKPPPLLEFLGPVAEHLQPYRFDRMVLVADQSVRLNCNWKAVIDNFSELYHVDFLHPQHKRMVDCCNDTVHLFENGHTGLAVPGATVNPRFPVPEEPTDIQSAQLLSLGLDPADFRGDVLGVRRAVQLRKREIGAARGFHYDEFDDAQLSDVWQYNLFPNVILSFTPEHCWVMRPRPHPTDPARCVFDKMSLVMFGDRDLAQEGVEILGPGRHAVTEDGFKPEDYSRPRRDEFDYGAVIAGEKTMTDTIDQDVELLGGVQAGMSSAAFDTTFLNDDEMRVQHFHDRWEAIMGKR